MPSFDLKALETSFKQPLIQAHFAGLYQCLGFITAIASSPDQVKPSEWITQLMLSDNNVPEFESEQQAAAFSENLIGWWSRCNAIFEHEGTLQLPQKLALTPSGKANKALIEFSIGYLKGYDWLSSTWQKMLPDDNEEANRSLSVLSLILARFINEKSVAKAHPELFSQLPDLPGCFKVLPNLLTAVGMLGKDLASEELPPGKPQVASIPIKNIQKGIGRNDPCPCGSGKKFKKCCLH